MAVSRLLLTLLGGAAALAPSALHQAKFVRSSARTVPTALRPAAFASTRASARMVLAPPAATVDAADVSIPPLLSGLQGKALDIAQMDVPSKSQVRAVVPDGCFRRDTARSLGHLAQSSVLTALCVAAGAKLIPMTSLALPLWLLYAVVTGTVAMGLWVLAHECGHGAFSDNRLLQDGVGYALHSLLLVPYYSWQRSHAVHHAHTNHVIKL